MSQKPDNAGTFFGKFVQATLNGGPEGCEGWQFEQDGIQLYARKSDEAVPWSVVYSDNRFSATVRGRTLREILLCLESRVRFQYDGKEFPSKLLGPAGEARIPLNYDWFAPKGLIDDGKSGLHLGRVLSVKGFWFSRTQEGDLRGSILGRELVFRYVQRREGQAEWLLTMAKHGSPRFFSPQFWMATGNSPGLALLELDLVLDGKILALLEKNREVGEFLGGI